MSLPSSDIDDQLKEILNQNNTTQGDIAFLIFLLFMILSGNILVE